MVPSLDDVMCLFSCWFSCHSEPLQAWKNWGLFASHSFFFGPLVFSSLTPALPNRSVRVLSPAGPPATSFSICPSLGVHLHGPDSQLHCSFTQFLEASSWLHLALSLHPDLSHPWTPRAYRLASHHSLVISLPCVFPLPQITLWVL